MEKKTSKNTVIVWLLSLLTVAFIATQSELIAGVFAYFIEIIKPILWGLGIAYLLNPLLKWFEAKTKLGRGLSVTIIYLFILLLTVTTLMIIVPLSYNSATEIIKDIPSYSQEVEQWFQDRFSDVKSLERVAKTYNINIKLLAPADLDKWLTDLTNQAQNVVFSFGGAVFSFTSGVFKFIMGVILSIYLLLAKESDVYYSKRFFRAFLGEERAQNFFEILAEANVTFYKYLVGKTIDSAIIGVLCFIGLSVLGVRYAVLFAVIVGVTNMIPYFGPFIGAAPLIIVTFFISPIQSLWVAIFILILQQLDGNFIGPMILGERTGLSPIMVIIAVVIGGGLFGVLGMLFCVPFVAVMKNILTRHIANVLDD